MCNQAIMLITDGAMEDFESVFEEFNWPERRVRTRTEEVKLSSIKSLFPSKKLEEPRILVEYL